MPFTETTLKACHFKKKKNLQKKKSGNLSMTDSMSTNLQNMPGKIEMNQQQQAFFKR